MQNNAVADRLDEVAEILEVQGANVFRVAAYRRAALMLRSLEQPVEEIVKAEGIDGLLKLPGIGQTLARFIHQLVVTGRLPILDRLRGESDPVALLQTVPGIGRVTAKKLYEKLGIEGLEELEIAAYDGRLSKLRVGGKRIKGIRDSLSARLGRVRSGKRFDGVEPPVREILDVDNEYRKRADAEELPKIAPRRFNPYHKRWLPILHTTRGERHYSAMFSNTARAHQLNMTSDWVVIYYDGARGERQCTVITSHYGPLQGRRIVRGRERECLRHYLKTTPTPIRRAVIHGFSNLKAPAKGLKQIPLW
jgi:putative hydrolase